MPRPLWLPDGGVISSPPSSPPPAALGDVGAAPQDAGVRASWIAPAAPREAPPTAAGAGCGDGCPGDEPPTGCAECQTSADCADPGHAHCDLARGECTPCVDSADCEGIEVDGRALGACDTTTGHCVECTGRDYRGCGVDVESFTPLLCDSQTRTCSQLREAGSHVCDPCVSDAQCQPGQRCVPELFDGWMLGYVCLWVPGSPVPDAPSDCLNQGRPYVDRRRNMESIDGEQVDVCALRATTCKALAEHAAKVRACRSAGDDSACGQPGLEDARCRSPEGSTAFRCVSRCGSSEDCKRGFACDTSAYPSYCAVQVDSCFADTDCVAQQRCVQQRCQPNRD